MIFKNTFIGGMSTGFVFGDLIYLSLQVHSISILLFYIQFIDELLKLIGLHKEFMYKLVVDLNQRNVSFTNLHLL